jgi:hypothetical protein
MALDAAGHTLLGPQPLTKEEFDAQVKDAMAKIESLSCSRVVLPDFDIVEKRVVASLVQEGYETVDIAIARRTHTIIGEILQEQQLNMFK